MQQHRTLAAFTTLFLGIAGVGVPLALITASMLRQGAAFYADITSGRIDFGAYLQRVVVALPPWVFEGLDKLGLGDLAAVQAKLSAGAAGAIQSIAAHLVSISADTFDFLISFGVMLYLLFFLLREGTELAANVIRAIPLADKDRQALVTTLTTVVQATVRGGFAMAATQGVLGGAMLSFLGIPGPLLWGMVFGLLSMLPAVGASLLWLPIALYFFVTGAVWKAITLTVFGAVVLTVVDNILRPLLVGRGTQLPSYLVLISTLGGVATFGINGVVIGPVVAAMFVAIWKLVASATEAKSA